MQQQSIHRFGALSSLNAAMFPTICTSKRPRGTPEPAERRPPPPSQFNADATPRTTIDPAVLSNLVMHHSGQDPGPGSSSALGSGSGSGLSQSFTDELNDAVPTEPDGLPADLDLNLLMEYNLNEDHSYGKSNAPWSYPISSHIASVPSYDAIAPYTIPFTDAHALGQGSFNPTALPPGPQPPIIIDAANSGNADDSNTSGDMLLTDEDSDDGSELDESIAKLHTAGPPIRDPWPTGPSVPDNLQVDVKTERTQPISQEQWDRHKPLINLLYARFGLTAKQVSEALETAHGFKATPRMYKPQFKRWGMKKNKRNGKGRPALSEEEPMHAPTNSYDLSQMIKAVEAICDQNLTNISDNGWKLREDYLVEEDEWDDAMCETLLFIEKLQAQPPSQAMPVEPLDAPQMEDLDEFLAPMVQEFGFFTLPTILTLASRMCVKLKAHPGLMQRTVSNFLDKCRTFAGPPLSARHEPLNQFLRHAGQICRDDPESLEGLFEFIYSSYIGRVYISPAAHKATALSLVALWVVYLNPKYYHLEETLVQLEDLLKRCERDTGLTSKQTLDLLGLRIMILQKIPEKTEQLRVSCMSVIKRALAKRKESQGPLDERTNQDLTEKILDSFHVLAKLTAKGGDRMALEAALDQYGEYMNEAEKSKIEDAMKRLAEMDMESLRKQLESTTISL